MDREPAVAGRFYTDRPDALRREVDAFLQAGGERVRAKGIVAPHAGYVYSGAIAGAVYARVEVPARVVVLGPNHTGRGEEVALWPDGSWLLPTGDVPIDPALTAALAACPLVETDAEAHLLEHSIEVQLPFLARARPDVAIAALCLGRLRFLDCEALGKAVGRAAAAAGALVVASSDMSHYVPAAEANEKDHRALERILALDPEGLYSVVHRERISMCGIIPATVMLVAALEQGATRAELVRYGSSGDVTGDTRQVVGYAGVLVA
jgi:AmmeMemoRadiSam system protein B